MDIDVPYKAECHSKRWVGYFDLLGTQQLLVDRKYLEIFSIYSMAIEEAKKWAENSPVEYLCFSDTFVIYTKTNDAKSFAYIDQVARWFVYKLILNKIPVRGALSCDDFYADKANNLYYGMALLEAYQYGEAQNWLGFVLTPSAAEQAVNVGLPPEERLNYAKWDIPYCVTKNKKLDSKLYACLIGSWVKINGENPCVRPLAGMRMSVSNTRHEEKYDNTLNFMLKNQRKVKGE